MKYTLKDQVVVVTGAASGIGRALAKTLADKGAKLALSDINAEGLEATKQSIKTGSHVKTYIVDMSNRQMVFAHAEEVKRDFGTAHVVINNAGVSVVGSFDHLSIEELEWQININLWGVIYGTKAFLPMFLNQRQGCVVNISSVFGLVGFPYQGAYNITKFGVRGLTECLWTELEGTGVRALCVHPGGIATNINQGKRRAKLANHEESKFYALFDKLLVTPPEICACDIVEGIERGDSRVLSGSKSSTLFWLARLLPNSYPKILRLLAR